MNNFGIGPSTVYTGTDLETRAKDAATISRILKEAYAENIAPVVVSGGPPSPMWNWLFGSGPKPGQ